MGFSYIYWFGLAALRTIFAQSCDERDNNNAQWVLARWTAWRGFAHLNFCINRITDAKHSGIGFSRTAVKKKERREDEDDEDDNSHRQRTEQFRKVIKRDLVETVHRSCSTWAMPFRRLSSFAYVLVQKWMKLCEKLFLFKWIGSLRVGKPAESTTVARTNTHSPIQGDTW